MNKILFISNISRGVGSFCLSSMIAAKSIGLDFYYAANFSGISQEKIAEDEKKYGIKMINLPIQRSPFSLKNLNAYKALVRLIRKEDISYVHCNTPTGGVLGRLAGKKCKVKKVVYEAHGFHFYKGAPLKNWLLYYPIEKWLAHKTDLLITINKEDFDLAKRKFSLRKKGKIVYIPGVGIDLDNYTKSNHLRAKKRKELGLSDDTIVIISAGDLIKRKNYLVSIDTIANVAFDQVVYFICGNGPEKRSLEREINNRNLASKIKLLGFRKDIHELFNASDIFLFSSKQEGLARSVMEAMALGLPCIVSNIRGNTDLLEGENGGFLCPVDDYKYYASKIDCLCNDNELRKSMGDFNLERIKEYALYSIVDNIKIAYLNTFGLKE